MIYNDLLVRTIAYLLKCDFFFSNNKQHRKQPLAPDVKKALSKRKRAEVYAAPKSSWWAAAAAENVEVEGQGNDEDGEGGGDAGFETLREKLQVRIKEKQCNKPFDFY